MAHGARAATPPRRHTASAVQRRRAVVALAVGAHLLAVAADPHVAPHRRAVARAVVEAPLAVVGETRLEARPRAGLLRRRDDREQAAERAGDAARPPPRPPPAPRPRAA